MKQFLRPTLTAAAMAVALGMTASVYAQAAKTGATGTIDKTKASYIIGYQLVASVPGPIRESVDPAATAKAVQQALSGVKLTMTNAEIEAVMKPFMASVQVKAKAQYDQVSAKNKSEGDAFLAKNKSAPGVKITASGLQYQVITQGSGARPGPDDTVTINYIGTFVNGEAFDSSSKNGSTSPVSIPLAGVIPGFREGMQLMQTGGHYKIFIPSSLGYGAQPQSGMPPNATLIFDVTLVKTAPTPAGAPAPTAPGG
jgi:FKBP-type peptidyl-prolyl cis-trans isomerase